jgi:hypothetical protein
MGLATSAGQPAEAASLREQASGIDALYLSGHGQVSARLLDDLHTAKDQAREADQPTPLDLGGLRVLVDGRPLNKYPFRLATPNGFIGITDSTRLPALHVQPFAEHLHGVGAKASVGWFEEVAAGFTSGLRLTAHRVDVFSDWQGWAPSAEDRRRFVGRSAARLTREDGEAWTGFDFGRRKTGTLNARIYDKSRETQSKAGSYWPQLWQDRGDRYASDEAVTRVEVEFHRKALRQHGVGTAADAIELAPALWVTATTDWLSMRAPTSDETRSRWPVDPVWQRIQRPTFAQDAAGLERLREARGQATLRGIRPGLVGYLSTFAALVGVDSIEGVCDRLVAFVRDYEVVSGVTFADRVEAKRRKLRLA